LAASTSSVISSRHTNIPGIHLASAMAVLLSRAPVAVETAPPPRDHRWWAGPSWGGGVAAAGCLAPHEGRARAGVPTHALGPRGGTGMQLSARNQLKATVKSVKTGSVMAEVVLDVAGNEIVSVITKGSVDRLGIKQGDQVTAIIKATEIILGK
jgi:molybdopterin-binding protein